jgi:hypothetical protein
VPVHFHLAKIEVKDNGYPRTIGRVKFSEEGSTLCKGAIERPTAEEAEGIKEEFASAEFPKIIAIEAISDPPPGVDLSDKKVFVCHDFDDKIIMVHQRYENEDGSKGFLPWTRWSDGQWRVMEPDVMPFYGLRGAKEFSTLYLHEGSKAARRVKEMISGDLEVGRFPWLEEMRWGAHVGWIGGVHALARSDWAKLAAMGWKRVIIIADNDEKGRAIVPEIAQHFRVPTFVLAFTDSWPDSFDLGDEWPDSLFGDENQYIGPTYSQCLQPAMWATDEYEIRPDPEKDKTKKVYEIRPEFASQWTWVEKQDLMVNIELPHYRMAAPHFNAFIRPFSHVKDTLSLFHNYYTGNQMELTYDPSIEGTIVRVSSGVQAINLYSPGPIRAAPGDWTPWLEYLEHLFPVANDREIIKRWAATLVAKPDVRIIFGLLLMSEIQGVGKGTFARVLADLVGRDYASFPSASLIVVSPFNGWIAGKRLICVDEIYEGHSWKAYNKLKPYVTDESIEVNVKHLATWTMPNWTHYILMSNSKAALKIEASDRRWFIPEVTEELWPEDRFSEFYQWLRSGGLSAIAQWAKTFVQRGEGRWLRSSERAPMSGSKAALIAESRSETEQLLEELAEAMLDHDKPVAVSLNAVQAWINDRTKGRVYETPQHMSRIMQRKGLRPAKDRLKLNGIKHSILVSEAKMITWSEEDKARLRSAIKAPTDILTETM